MVIQGLSELNYNQYKVTVHNVNGTIKSSTPKQYNREKHVHLHIFCKNYVDDDCRTINGSYSFVDKRNSMITLSLANDINMSTIRHELRHFWQKDNGWSFSCDEVRYNDDGDYYYNLPFEVDAREWAASFESDVQEKSWKLTDWTNIKGIGKVKELAITKMLSELNSIDDLIKVKGIGKKTLEAIKQYLAE